MVINEPVLRVQRRGPQHSSAPYLFSVSRPRFREGVLHVQPTHASPAVHWLDEALRGKISLREAETLTDHKRILKKKKKRRKYSRVVTVLVFLRWTDCLCVM